MAPHLFVGDLIVLETKQWYEFVMVGILNIAATVPKKKI